MKLNKKESIFQVFSVVKYLKIDFFLLLKVDQQLYKRG